MRKYRLGSIQPVPSSTKNGKRREIFSLTDDQLENHVAIFGVTGAGKSRLLWQMLREHRRNKRGFLVVDSGDLIEDFLADSVSQFVDDQDRRIFQKIHVIELSPFQLARYDPLRFHYPKSYHPELQETIYKSWQHTKVQSFAENYQIKQGQNAGFEGMPRVQRMFQNVFTALSTLVDGKRLSVGNADLMIDIYNPDHHRVYAKIRPLLSREIVADFEILHQMKNVRDFRLEAESFLNRIRSMHGPLLKQMLTASVNDPCFAIHEAIGKSDYVFVKVSRSPFASNDQNNAIANMFIHDVMDAMLVTPRELRKPFSLFIEEAHKYVTPGIGDMARTARKLRLSLILATTDFVSLSKGDLDLASELIAVINTIVAFRMTGSEDVDRMARLLYSQNIDFTELLHKVERHGGYEWLQIDESSETYSKGKSRAEGTGRSDGTVEAEQDSIAAAKQKQISASVDRNGNLLGGGRSASDGLTHLSGKSLAKSNVDQKSSTISDSESYGVTLSHKWVHLEKILIEWDRTGKLERSVQDQFAQYSQIISGHSRRTASARVREGHGFEFTTATVKDPFLSPEARAAAVDWIVREIHRSHDYYFTPSLAPADDRLRIEEFLEGGAPSNVEPVRPRKQKAMGTRNPLL